MTRVWADLTADQADGRACVVCGRDFAALWCFAELWWGAKSRPAGRSVDGAQVFACVAHDEIDGPVAPRSKPDVQP